MSGKLVGIVSRANIMHALVSLSHGAKAPALGRRRHPRADPGRMREASLGARWRTSWCTTASSICGARSPTIGKRQAVMVASENVPGVKAVHDHLVWIEPNSGFVMESDEDAARTKASGQEVQTGNLAL